uniref:Uncharacterized protein n=1 Tax=Kalanchoe fedtschenkoi TaxID=63787 RepID=A0A7N0ZW12_KALFE
MGPEPEQNWNPQIPDRSVAITIAYFAAKGKPLKRTAPEPLPSPPPPRTYPISLATMASSSFLSVVSRGSVHVSSSLTTTTSTSHLAPPKPYHHHQLQNSNSKYRGRRGFLSLSCSRSGSDNVSSLSDDNGHFRFT